MDVDVAPRKGRTPLILTLPRPKKVVGAGGKKGGEGKQDGGDTRSQAIVRAMGGSVAQRIVQRRERASGG